MTTMEYRVFVDGIWDMFHDGHVNLLQKAKNKAAEFANGRTVILIVGVNGTGVEGYKRKTVMSLAERVNAVAHHRLVDQWIEDSKLVTTKKFIEEKKIDLVVHGDDFSEEKRDIYYKAAVELGKFSYVPYTDGISTTDLIRDAKEKRPFRTPLVHTLLPEVELISRIQSRTWKELNVEPSK